MTDSAAATATDSVSITVTPTSGGDTTAPVTSYSGTRTASKGIVSFSIRLTPNEPATTYYRAAGGGSITSGGSNTTAWQTYTGPVGITLNKSGSMTFEYYSVDTAGNTETTKSQVLQ